MAKQTLKTLLKDARKSAPSITFLGREWILDGISFIELKDVADSCDEKAAEIAAIHLLEDRETLKKQAPDEGLYQDISEEQRPELPKNLYEQKLQTYTGQYSRCLLAIYMLQDQKTGEYLRDMVQTEDEELSLIDQASKCYPLISAVAEYLDSLVPKEKNG